MRDDAVEATDREPETLRVLGVDEFLDLRPRPLFPTSNTDAES